MTEPHSTFDAVTEERAGLYALDLLPADERRQFEAQLGREAGLRELVRELQANLDAEVFQEPAPAAPLSVWGRISAQTRSDDTPVLKFPAAARLWGQRFLAAAACLTLGAGIHSWWGNRPASPVPVAGTPAGPIVEPAARPPLNVLPKPAPAARVTTPEAVASVSGPVPEAATPVRDPEKVLLERRVRALTAQVATLSQVLTQQMTVPGGVTRLHVFHLGHPGFTNAFASAAQDGKGVNLAETLARLAAERLAATQLPPALTSATDSTAATGIAAGTDPQTPPPETVGIVSVVPAAPEPGDTTVSLTTAGASVGGVSPAGPELSAISPIVFSLPETGLNALAVPTARTGQYQLWNRATDGTVTSLGVVPNSTSPVSVVTFEHSSPSGLFMSLEPVGGSLLPTGPILGGGSAANPP
jgi:anti-sigma-K factor RskA